MEDETNQRRFESVFSKKVRAGKRRTYFFDVRQTKGDDYYVTLTESTRKFDREGYERHKIFLYKEDFNRFLDGLHEAIDHVKTELMPDYDYDEFTKRHEEWEAQRLEDEKNGVTRDYSNNNNNSNASNNNKSNEDSVDKKEDVTEDDISW